MHVLPARRTRARTADGGTPPLGKFRDAKSVRDSALETFPARTPESSGDAGTAAFLHGPKRLFASVAPSKTADELLDDQVLGEVEETI